MLESAQKPFNNNGYIMLVEKMLCQPPFSIRDRPIYKMPIMGGYLNQ